MTEKRRTIIRAAHNAQPYFLMARSVAQNETLSYEALGLLAYLLSKPNDWEVHPEALAREKCGRDKAYRLLNELKKARHIERNVIKDGKGRIERIEYVVHESPLPENPYMENPDTDYPDTENQHITEYRGVQSTEYTLAPEQSHTNIVPFVPQPDGGARAYSLIEAWLDAWDITEPRYRKGTHSTQRKAAGQLADMEATPEDIAAMCAERRAKGKQPDEAKLAFLANDYVGWKSRRETSRITPIDPNVSAAVQAVEAEWERERQDYIAQLAGGAS